jgi:hypothetical protein
MGVGGGSTQHEDRRRLLSFFFNKERMLCGTGERNVSLLHSIQTDSGAHLASLPMGTGGDVWEVKRRGREIHYSSEFNAEVKNGELYQHFPNISS